MSLRFATKPQEAQAAEKEFVPSQRDRELTDFLYEDAVKQFTPIVAGDITKESLLKAISSASHHDHKPYGEQVAEIDQAVEAVLAENVTEQELDEILADASASAADFAFLAEEEQRLVDMVEIPDVDEKATASATAALEEESLGGPEDGPEIEITAELQKALEQVAPVNRLVVEPSNDIERAIAKSLKPFFERAEAGASVEELVAILEKIRPESETQAEFDALLQKLDEADVKAEAAQGGAAAASASTDAEQDYEETDVMLVEQMKLTIPQVAASEVFYDLDGNAIYYVNGERVCFPALSDSLDGVISSPPDLHLFEEVPLIKVCVSTFSSLFDSLSFQCSNVLTLNTKRFFSDRFSKYLSITTILSSPSHRASRHRQLFDEAKCGGSSLHFLQSNQVFSLSLL